jgi:hypothetical protein
MSPHFLEELGRHARCWDAPVLSRKAWMITAGVTVACSGVACGGGLLE